MSCAKWHCFVKGRYNSRLCYLSYVKLSRVFSSCFLTKISLVECLYSDRKKRDASSSLSTMSEDVKNEGEGSAATMVTSSEVLEEVSQERTDKTIGHWQGKGSIYAIDEGNEVFLREQICIQVIQCLIVCQLI